MTGYSWSGPGGFTASTQCITVTTGGTYTVAITDANGCTNRCTASLTVHTAPTIGCPNNISTNADAGQCAALLAFSPNVTGDPAPAVECKIGATVITSPHAFPVGTNTVSCTASNECGVDSCNFTVTVNDNQAPTITCPADVTVTNPPGESCASGVALGTPVTGDNCAVASVTSDAPSSFPAGTNLVIWTVTDVHNNTATCTQQVIVVLTAVDANSFRILGIQAVGNDINLTWLTVGNSTNVVQVAAQTPDGGYTNSYGDVDMVFVPGSGAVITNWVDVGGATMWRQREAPRHRHGQRGRDPTRIFPSHGRRLAATPPQSHSRHTSMRYRATP